MNPFVSSFDANGQVTLKEVENACFIDMDDTALHLNPEWIRRYNLKTGESKTVDDVIHYDYMRCIGFKPEIYDILKDEDLFTSLVTMDGALEAIERISEFYYVLVVTHAVHGNAAQAKHDWVERNLRLHPNFREKQIVKHICTLASKGFLSGAAIIDDSPLSVSAHKASCGGLTLGIEQPWNAQFSQHYDLLAKDHFNPRKAWTEIADFLIAKKKNSQEGYRFNRDKTPWYLMPSLAINYCLPLVPRINPSRRIIENMRISVSNLLRWYGKNTLNNLGFAAIAAISAASRLKSTASAIDVFVSGLHAIAEVMQFGAKKYKARNWENGLMVEQTFSSAMRHAEKFLSGEDVDSESNLPHTSHYAWNILVNLEIYLRAKEDDKYKRFVERHDWRKA